jgi:triosephosphate isomerase
MFLKASIPTRLITALTCLATTASVLPASLSSNNSPIEAFKNIIIAYEPVWAIGTGVTATPQQAQDTHAYIRELLAQSDADIAQSTPILYGGSMNPSNADELIACEDIDGGLIGGASLKPNDFLRICKAG